MNLPNVGVSVEHNAVVVRDRGVSLVGQFDVSVRHLVYATFFDVVVPFGGRLIVESGGNLGVSKVH